MHSDNFLGIIFPLKCKIPGCLGKSDSHKTRSCLGDYSIPDK